MGNRENFTHADPIVTWASGDFDGGGAGTREDLTAGGIGDIALYIFYMCLHLVPMSPSFIKKLPKMSLAEDQAQEIKQGRAKGGGSFIGKGIRGFSLDLGCNEDENQGHQTGSG